MTIRRIGLSLGADIDWPIAFEEIMSRLDPVVDVDGDPVRFEVERVTIEPFDLRQPVRYDVVLDRLTHWYEPSREWIKKAVIQNDLYVLNNPWTLQSMEKQASYAAMMRLGMPVPDTWLIPPKAYEPHPDLEVTLQRYARLFDLGEIGARLGYPLFMKPYSGGGWVGVERVTNEQELRDAYERSGKRLMLLQQAIEPWDLFVRAVGIGPQVKVIRYDPSAPLHERYVQDFGFMTDEEVRHVEDLTLTINAFFGWDFNSCESIRRDGVFHPIDFANACPDSQVTSLHYFFPWLVTSKVRWAVFVAATRRPMRKLPDVEPFFAIAAEGLPFDEALPRYGALARRILDEDRFVEFCATQLTHLDEVAWEFFGTPRAREAVFLKVKALFPEHEVEAFTEHFWQRIQRWREDVAAGRDEVRVSGPEVAYLERFGAGLAAEAETGS